MKKLYKKGKVHPSPPLISDHLAFLPATILCLTVALSPEDKEVLAYLISCSGGNTSTSSSTSFNGGNNKKNTQTQNQKNLINGVGSSSSSTEHPPLFHCDCFRCYTSFWVRWDSSPNRQLIHEIIDAFEDELSERKKKMKMKSKKEKKKKGSSSSSSGNGNGFVLDEMKRFEEIGNRVDEMGVIESVVINEEIGDGDDDDEEEEEMDLGEKGSMRRFMSFVGERIWGVWGQ